MTRNSRKLEKYASGERGFRASTRGIRLNEHKGVSLNEHLGVPLNKSVGMPAIVAINETGLPFHIVTKKEIEEELAQVEELYGMPLEEFYQAWKRDEIHDFHAMILGNLYESYKQRYK